MLFILPFTQKNLKTVMTGYKAIKFTRYCNAI